MLLLEIEVQIHKNYIEIFTGWRSVNIRRDDLGSVDLYEDYYTGEYSICLEYTEGKYEQIRGFKNRLQAKRLVSKIRRWLENKEVSDEQ
jgi:hypothetical protein